MKHANGDDEANNKHLAEAIDLTREGSAPVGRSTGYDDPHGAGPNYSLRDSCFEGAIDALQKISTAPEESQEEIDQVLDLLQRALFEDEQRQSQVMAKAHERLQDVWAPPE